MRYLFALVFALSAIGLIRAADPPADDFSIDKFDFEWQAAESGKASIAVNKTQDTTRIILRDGAIIGATLLIKPKDAEQIGEALSKTDEYYRKLKASDDDKQEEIKAGGHRIVFINSQKNGFAVLIIPDKQFTMDKLQLDRAQAKAFAKPLQKSVKMAEFIDKKIQP